MKNLWGMLALQRVLAHRVLIGSRFILLSFTSDHIVETIFNMILLCGGKGTNMTCYKRMILQVYTI